MTICESYSHRGGAELCVGVTAFNEFVAHLCSLQVPFVRGSSAELKSAAKAVLMNAGWATNVKVRPPYKPDINASRDGLGLTIQTGNISRAFYDLLKLESLFVGERIRAAVLIVPCSTAARRLGQNIANFERVQSELENVYASVITVPCMLISLGD